MATLIQLRQRMYYRLRDIPDPTDITVRTDARIDDAMYDLWINASVTRIVTDTLCLEDTATLTPDGVESAFVLAGAGADEVAADYIGLASIDHANGVIEEHPGGINAIRQLEVDGEIVAGDPVYYAIFGDMIYFDTIPPADLTLNFFYYAAPTELALDADVPDTPIDLYTSLIVSGAISEFADDEGDDNLMMRNESIYQKKLQTFRDRTEAHGKHQRKTGADTNYL